MGFSNIYAGAPATAPKKGDKEGSGSSSDSSSSDSSSDSDSDSESDGEGEKAAKTAAHREAMGEQERVLCPSYLVPAPCSLLALSSLEASVVPRLQTLPMQLNHWAKSRHPTGCFFFTGPT